MTLPPQAYTRDILIKAYEWLREQPPAVKEKAKDADSLVSLYMQLRRRTSQDSWEQKVSAETFKNDLRHLAEDMKQFEAPMPTPAPTSPPPKTMAHVIEQPMAVQAKNSPNLDERSLKMLREIQQRFNLSHEGEALRMLIVLGYEKVTNVLTAPSI